MLSRLAILALLATPGLALAQGSYGTPATPGAAPMATGMREYHIMTVHLDAATGLTASANHPAEAFPTQPLPAGGGLILRAPNAEGNWSMRAFIFVPSQIIVRQGDAVALNFVDIQGPRFRIAVDGTAEPIAISRGQIQRVVVNTSTPGTISFRSLDHAPTMTGEVVVLPR